MKQLDLTAINRCCELLLQDEIIIIPTDTIYGLSAIVSKQNAKKINELKQSDLKKPLIILVANLEQASDFIEVTEEVKNLLLEKEPTTVIFKKPGMEETRAIRMVQREDIKQIINRCGPIYSTSVNRSGTDYLRKKEDLESFLDKNKVFFTENLMGKPSKIFDFINKSKKR